MTIVEFLTARLDEESRFWANPSAMRFGGVGLSDLILRMRADVTAKQRLVELCATWIAEGERHVAGRDAVSIAARTQAITAETTVRALAQPYDTREDFDPAWRLDA